MEAIRSYSDLLARAGQLADRGDRAILGITGAPGAGKSTLAQRLVGNLGPDCARLVGMDGFHLAQAELVRLGRAERKGAPDTFDAGGYLALLRRLRVADEAVVYAPTFDRGIEEPIGSATPIPAAVPLVITEGNYLLLDQPGWAEIGNLLDECLFLEIDEATRLERLVARHQRYGRSRAEADSRAGGSDQRNAEVVAATRPRADLIVGPDVLVGDT